MAKNLEVKNLRISFRTNNGKVQAVRDISFDLEKGRTMAIVGESGSGKSVTSRAIMGILAGNSIIEDGEIVYDGKDLLKIPEDEMYKIRGDKVAMIFQDPLSSLNPIMRTGKQITEAMLLKNKASRKDAKKEFNRILSLLNTNMVAADPANAAKIKEMIATLEKMAMAGNHMEQSFNNSSANALILVEAIEEFLFRVDKNVKMDLLDEMKGCNKRLQTINDAFFIAKFDARLKAVTKKLNDAVAKCTKGQQGIPAELRAVLTELEKLMREMMEQKKPNFFALGYYSLKNPSEKLGAQDVDALNKKAEDLLNNTFLKEFHVAQVKGLRYSAQQTLAVKKEALAALTAEKAFFQGEFSKKEALGRAKKLADLVEKSIDRLEIEKDNLAYIFRIGINSSINSYFAAVVNNPKEEARFAKQTAKHEKQAAKGKGADWKVVPKNIYDLDHLKARILTYITRLEKHYENLIANAGSIDFEKRAVDIVEYMKDRAARIIYKVTKAMAKEKAIALMEEVGINEPRRRYNQYPFEFSGGMRQRIVIAIALSADPEILICDEPTTALDVTIQAQILELINNLKRERNLSVIFITHDLGVVANMADDIAVMYAGKIVEYGTAEDIFYDPRHPYTWALLSSMPDLDTKEKLDAIPGTPPNMIYPPVGDAFADRNKYAMEIDFEMQPPMFEISETHKAATWLLHPNAPKVEVPKAITDRVARMTRAGGDQK